MLIISLLIIMETCTKGYGWRSLDHLAANSIIEDVLTIVIEESMWREHTLATPAVVPGDDRCTAAVALASEASATSSATADAMPRGCGNTPCGARPARRRPRRSRHPRPADPRCHPERICHCTFSPHLHIISQTRVGDSYEFRERTLFSR